VIDDQPVSRVEWVPRDGLASNAWNPNIQAPPEHKLLRVSLLENGWTMPIVTRQEPTGLEIVDGYHRWSLSADKDVAAMTRASQRDALLAERKQLEDRLAVIDTQLADAADAVAVLVPVVRLAECPPDVARMATIRHNRARGTHHVLKMADIVAELLDMGLAPEEIGRRLQMDEEEVDRLADRGQMTKRGAAAQFGNGWTV
jgi:ParB-like chromosome segregation protein Spo0J